jgi:hypothetical protein
MVSLGHLGKLQKVEVKLVEVGQEPVLMLVKQLLDLPVGGERALLGQAERRITRKDEAAGLMQLHYHVLGRSLCHLQVPHGLHFAAYI